jgi:excisionase family DNA binding protein
MNLLTEKQIAKALQVSIPKLRKDRVEQKGIPYFKIGNLVRYSMDQVMKHLEDKQLSK